ncbi:hypothetical protein TNCV_3068121 [Trichonephila clavipes]|nr:hypothetical protein TNCV_3068121 [Trichonephila clavipes]
MTLCHSCVQFCRPVPLSRHLSLRCIMKGSRSITTAAANVFTPYERILGMLQTFPFPNGLGSGCKVLQVSPQNLSILSNISYKKLWRSSMPFCMAPSSPLIPYLHDSGRIHISGLSFS